MSSSLLHLGSFPSFARPGSAQPASQRPPGMKYQTACSAKRDCRLATGICRKSETVSPKSCIQEQFDLVLCMRTAFHANLRYVRKKTLLSISLMMLESVPYCKCHKCPHRCSQEHMIYEKRYRQSGTSIPVLHILIPTTLSNKKSTLPFDFALRDTVLRRGAECGPLKEGRGQEQEPRVHIQGSASG